MYLIIYNVYCMPYSVIYYKYINGATLVTQLVKNPPAVQETLV